MITLPNGLKSSSLVVFQGGFMVFHGFWLVFMVFQGGFTVFHGFGLVMMTMITIIGKNNPKCVSVWATVRGIFIVSNSKFYVLASLSTSLQFIQEHIFLYAPFTAFFQIQSLW